jgi:hypothetical protein
MNFSMSEFPNKYYLMEEKATDEKRWLSVFVKATPRL